MSIPDYNSPFCFRRTLFRIEPVKETRFYESLLEVKADTKIIVTVSIAVREKQIELKQEAQLHCDIFFQIGATYNN